MNRPNPAEEQEAARLEEFLNARRSEPDAMQTNDLDPALAEMARLAAEYERPDVSISKYAEAARQRVWQKALASMETEKVSPTATQTPQANLSVNLLSEGRARAKNGLSPAVLLAKEPVNKTRQVNWPHLMLGGMAATIVVIVGVFALLLFTPGPQTPAKSIGSVASKATPSQAVQTPTNPAIKITPTQPPQPTPTPYPSSKITLQIASGTFTESQAQATAKVLENRMLALGFSYAKATVDGSQIKIDLRGTVDKDIVKRTASAVGRVEFVDTTGNASIQVGDHLQTTYCTSGSLLKPQVGLCVPTAAESNPKFTPVPGGRSTQDGKPFQTIITGEDIIPESLVIKKNDTGYDSLNFTLKPEAANIMKSFTEAHIGKPMAITIDGAVIVNATIQGVISDKSEITFPTGTSLTNFIAMVKSGPLPLPLFFVDIS